MTNKPMANAIVTFTLENQGKFYDIKNDGSHAEAEIAFFKSIPQSYVLSPSVIAEFGLYYFVNNERFIVNANPDRIIIRADGGKRIPTAVRERVKSRIVSNFRVDPSLISESSLVKKVEKEMDFDEVGI